MISLVIPRLLCGLLLFRVAVAAAQETTFLGFDRNDYPGDANLAVLRRTFSYAGYWLNDPPGEKSNTWTGKRSALESAGFGFLVLFNGRLSKELKHDSVILAQSDAQAAVAAARGEGFPAQTILFLDIEEGGRMPPEQKSYIYAWADAVSAAGFRPGVYCSGIPAKEGKTSIVTANDIRDNAQGRKLAYWVTQDSCPPSPGCVFPKQPPKPPNSGTPSADVWQFVQSPRRRDFAAMCHNYNSDGNCYPPGIDPASHLHFDLNTATSADPSAGR
jgi:hypothetical protein